MRIVSVGATDDQPMEQMARLLLDGFTSTSPEAWTNLAEARETVGEVLSTGFARAAVDEAGTVVGWIGGLPEYDGHVWELHPLVVSPAQQGQGIGRQLVLDFEDQVRSRGGLTVILGSDDESGLTTLSGVNLYDDLPAKIAQARGFRPHPLEFYRALGYTIVGVIPDANGVGKPDIILAKRM